MFVSAIAGVSPYLRTPEGFTGEIGRFEGKGIGVDCGSGCGAGAPGAEGGFCRVEVGDGVAVVLLDCDAKIIAVKDAPAAAEPAAMRANVDFDITAM